MGRPLTTIPMTFDATTAQPVAEFDPNSAKPVEFDASSAQPEPESNPFTDFATRVARSAVTGAGDAIAYAGRVGKTSHDAITDVNQRTAEFLGVGSRDSFQAQREEGTRITSPVIAAGQTLKEGATAFQPDPQRDGEIKSVVADVVGGAVPSLVSLLTTGPVTPVAVIAGQMGEAQRDTAISQGDTSEVADAKGKIAAAGGALLGLVPGGPTRAGAGIVERLATRAVTGGAINAAQDAAMQTALDEKVDWGRVRLNGAIGAGLGLVLGVPEALALRRSLGSRADTNGKTLGEAINAIASETGATPTEIQARINAAVGIKPAPTAAETLVRQTEAEHALAAPAAAENAARAEAQQRNEAMATRSQDVKAALAARENAQAAEMRSELNRRQLGPEQSPESQAWLHEGGPATQAEAGLTTLDSELGKDRGAARERARLQSQLPEDSPLRSGAPVVEESPLRPKMSVQAQRLYDEHGGVDPAALLPVARAALGGYLGYASGDKPEERIRNALLGMGFGALASPALVRRLVNSVTNATVTREITDLADRRLTQLRLKLAPQSILPDELRTQLRWGEQASTSITSMGQSLTRDLERSIQGVGDKAAQGAAAEQVQGFLTGTIQAAALPAPLRVAAQKVRDYVDALTDRAISEGVVRGQLANTFLSNKGSYLRRSYEIFLNPDYQPAPAVVNEAIDAVARANGVSRPEAEGVVAGLLDKHGRATLGDFLVGRGKLGGKDVGSLVKRHDLLPEIRALLGEVSDPILATNQTIPRMARLIEMDATQRQVRAIGQRLGIFSETQSLSHPTPLVSEGSGTHDVLSGLFTSPDVAAAMQREAGGGRTAFIPEMLWKGLTTASMTAKLAKTVGNPESYMPNFLGGIVSNIGNGNFRYSHTARGLALGAEELGALRQFLPDSPTRDALRIELAELHRLGVVGEAVNSQDLLRTIESSFFGRLRDKAARVLALPARVYGSVDDFNRYVAWQSEKARYAKALPGLSPDELSRHAAEVVRATTPVYSEVPKAIKQLSIAGLAPSFVNFTWEVFRNTKNTVKIGLRDLQEGRVTNNPALVRAGAERLASITAVTAAASMWGASKLSRDANGIDDAKDAAVRYLSPPWNRDGVLVYQSPAGAGKLVQVSNVSYLIPHALLWQAIEAGRRGSDRGQAVPEYLRALNEQFGFGNSVLIPPVAGAIQGFDPKTGRQIPSTAVEPTIGDRARYLAGEAFAPLVLDQAEKWRKAFAGEQGDFGRVYSVGEQMQRLAGVRAQTLDPEKAVQWRARDIGERLKRAAELYRLRANQKLTGERLDAAYADSDAARRSQFADMAQMIAHGRALGVNDGQIIQSLRGARVPAADILAAFDGKYRPLEREKPKTAGSFLAEILARPAQERAAAVADVFRQDPAMGRAILGRVKEAAKGRDGRDQLMFSLGVEDGERADYLRQKLVEISDPNARQAWLLDLRKKGILTERVIKQMATPPR